MKIHAAQHQKEKKRGKNQKNNGDWLTASSLGLNSTAISATYSTTENSYINFGKAAKKNAVSATITSGAYNELAATKRNVDDSEGTENSLQQTNIPLFSSLNSSESTPPLIAHSTVPKKIMSKFKYIDVQPVKGGTSLLWTFQRPTATSGVKISSLYRENNSLTTPTTTTKKCSAANNSQAYKVNTPITSRSLPELCSSGQVSVSLPKQLKTNLSVKKATVVDDISVINKIRSAHNSQLKRRDSVSDQSKCMHSVVAESIDKTKNNLIDTAADNNNSIDVCLNTVSGTKKSLNGFDETINEKTDENMNNINDSPSIINIDSLPEVAAPIRRPRSDHLYQIMQNEKNRSKPQNLMQLIPVTNTVQTPSGSSSGSRIEIRNGQLNDPSGSIRYLDNSKSRLLNLKIVQENQMIASLTKEEKARKLQASIKSDVSALEQLEQKKMELKNEAKKACLTYSAIDNLNKMNRKRSKPSPKHLLSFRMANLTKTTKRSVADGIVKTVSGHQLLSKDPQWLTRALSSNNDSSSNSSRGSRPTSRQSSEFPKDEDNRDIDALLTWNSKKTIGRLPNTGLIFERNEFNMLEINTLAMTKMNAVYNEKVDKSDYLPRMRAEKLACGHNFSTECFDDLMLRMNSNLKLEINGRLPHEYFSKEIKECIGALIWNKNNNCHAVALADIIRALNNSQMESRINGNVFVWARFIDYYNQKNKQKRPMKLAPAHLFANQIPSIPLNTIEIGQKLEAIDPINNVFCVCTVVEKCAMRLKLHFDGYSQIYDFWINADSNAIFPPGFCNKTGRVLEPPLGRMATSSRAPFDWKEYLKRTNSSPAHRACFPHLENAVKKTNMNPFKNDLKFEAENCGKISVATVGDVLDTRILVKFDNYEETYNFWTDITSPYIHPIGWHAEYGFPIQTAPDRTHKVLHWDDYLKKTRSEAVPASAFNVRQSYLFEAGMVLEAVDKKNPNLIRPAIITEVKDYEIKILYIGWPERYAYWIRDDSTDIFPPGYCRKTNHPIECPLDEVYAGFGLKLKCVQGCRGMGNTMIPDRFGHASIDECPYEEKSFRMDQSKLLPNRLERKPKINTPVNNGIRHVSRQGQCMLRDNAQLSLLPVLNPVELAVMAPKDIELFRRLQVSANFLMDNIGSMSDAHQKWMKNLEPTKSMKISVASENPLHWSVEKVAEFVSGLPNCSEIGATFIEHGIDGVALLSLRQDDMIDVMSLSLGMAIKIFNRISFLREECNAKYIQYE